MWGRKNSMNSRNKADLVVHGGKIWTGYGNPIVEAIAVLGNKVLASGSDAHIKALVEPGTKVVDLAGRFAMPGLNDAHLHLISTGLLRGKVDATPDAAPTRGAQQPIMDASRLHDDEVSARVKACHIGGDRIGLAVDRTMDFSQ